MAAPKHGELIQGQKYLTVVCSNAECNNIIPIGPAGQVYFSGHGKLQIGCPFCGEMGKHDPNEAKARKLEVLPPTAQ